MSVKAIAKNVRMSPRKVGVVASLVRGRTTKDALIILEHTPRRSAEPVIKVIKSAIANAEHNHNYKPDTLKITEIMVTHGARLKRYRPVAKGSAHPFIRRSSHIRVVLEGNKREIKKTVDKKPGSASKEATK